MTTFRITKERYLELTECYIGLCLECGAERDTCEPDARNYPCEDCGNNSVYGAEELLLSGNIEIKT